MVVSIYIPPAVPEDLLFSTFSPAFTVCTGFDNGHSDWYEVTLHYSLYVNFSNNDWCWTSFSHVCWPSVHPLWKNVYLGLLTIFWLSYLFFWYWAAFVFLRLSHVGWFVCEYFLQFWRLSFHLVYGFQCCANALKFNQVPFVFLFLFSRRQIKRFLATIYVRVFYLCFPVTVL